MSDEHASGLFGPLEARGLTSEAVSDAAFLRAMLRAEGALAGALADAGLIPLGHADQIDGVCRGPAPDVDQVGRDAAQTGTPVVPLVDALRAQLDPDVAASLHLGATSQDIMDTALMLTAAGAVRMILADLEQATVRGREFVALYEATPLTGRTLLQAARPTTFGAKAAGWVDGLEAAIVELGRIREQRLAVQLGGPVGTHEAWGPDPDALVRGYAGRLGLAVPEAAWHTERSRVVELAGSVAVAAAAIAKIGLDVVLLAQSEIGEAADSDTTRGGSSAMPHKRNQIAAVLARANAMRAASLVGSLVTIASGGEHERAAGSWHAERATLRDLLVATGSAAAWLRDTLEHLAIDEDRMLRNLEAAGLDASGAAIDAAARVARRASVRMRSSTASPIDVHHVAAGSERAPVVVFSNSLGSTLEMWDEVSSQVAGTYRVIRYDLRGHGRSTSPPGPYAIEDLAADLLALLDRLGVERASLVGSSIGGMASLWVAAQAPERVDRLVAIGSAARLGPARNWIDRSRVVLRDGTRPLADVVTPRWVSPDYAAAHPADMARYRQMFASADPAGYAGCCIAIAGMDLTAMLGSISAPTLVVVGSKDPATPPDLSRAMVEAIPAARLAILDGAAHLPSLDRPTAVAELVLEHLA